MENKPQIGLGEYLRSEREKRHITVEQVASATKINIKLLHALESDNYDSLPAKPFVRGFVTSYTRYVGLDYREVLARFDLYLDEKSGQKFRRPADAPHIFVEREGQVDNSKNMLAIVLVGFLVIGVVLFVLFKPVLKHHKGKKEKSPVGNEEVMTVPPPPSDSAPITVKPTPSASPIPHTTAPEPTTVPTATTPTSTPAAPDKPNLETKTETKLESKPEAKPELKIDTKPAPSATPTPTATAKPAAGFVKLPPIPANEVKYRLVVRAIEDAWVKYQVDDRPVQAYTLRKDKVIWVRARSSLRFTTAKPSAIEISHDNKEFKPFGSAKVIIEPKEAETQFKTSPFVDPNPTYLSTPLQ